MKLAKSQQAALQGLYDGTLKDNTILHGVNVKRSLEALADKGVISRTGIGAYMIPFGSPGADLVEHSRALKNP